MEDLGKINSMQLYRIWRNLTVCLLSVIVMIMFSRLLPSYLSPLIALICAAFLYTYIYDNRAKHDTSCQVSTFGMLYAMVGYSFVTILINVLDLWNVVLFPSELILFNDPPFIPILIFAPVGFLVYVWMLLRRKKLNVCTNCRLNSNFGYERRGLGALFSRESHLQLRNLTLLFGIVTIVVWSYYLVFYINININARDWYIFFWIVIVSFLADEFFFISRYYNLYLDMKENDEIITPEEIQDMTAKTYLRYYVICGNNIYVDPHVIDPSAPYKEVIDTPFFTRRAVNGISVDEVKNIIRTMTGVDGELRFFFGRKSDHLKNHSILRYFYFLDGELKDYPKLKTDGEWMDYEKIKYLYANNPGRLADISVSDTTRLATILLTEKIFDENGYRKSKIKYYKPSFNLLDVRKSNLDFQDDKWIKISLFNSDTPFYGLKRRWRLITKGSVN